MGNTVCCCEKDEKDEIQKRSESWLIISQSDVVVLTEPGKSRSGSLHETTLETEEIQIVIGGEKMTNKNESRLTIAAKNVTENGCELGEKLSKSSTVENQIRVEVEENKEQIVVASEVDERNSEVKKERKSCISLKNSSEDKAKKENVAKMVVDNDNKDETMIETETGIEIINSMLVTVIEKIGCEVVETVETTKQSVDNVEERQEETVVIPTLVGAEQENECKDTESEELSQVGTGREDLNQECSAENVEEENEGIESQRNYESLVEDDAQDCSETTEETDCQTNNIVKEEDRIEDDRES